MVRCVAWFDESEDEMTVRITFEDGTKRLFGDSYRAWKDQLSEYCYRFNAQPVKAEKSKTDWIKYGGLKWCSACALGGELELEGQGRKPSDFEPWIEFDLSNTRI